MVEAQYSLRITSLRLFVILSIVRFNLSLPYCEVICASNSPIY